MHYVEYTAGFGFVIDPATGKRFMNETANRKVRADAISALKHSALYICTFANAKKHTPALHLQKATENGSVKSYASIGACPSPRAMPVETGKNVWDSEIQALIGQQSISEKTNEITVLSEILTSLNLQGAVLTADALNTQVATIEAIQSVGADYCLTVKQNHKELSDECSRSSMAWASTNRPSKPSRRTSSSGTGGSRTISITSWTSSLTRTA